MPANTSPVFPITPVSSAVVCSAANSGLDGSGTVPTVCTAGANGTRIEYIRIKAFTATTNGMLRLFIHNGSSSFLWAEVAVTAATPSATVKSFEAELVPTKPLVLPSGSSLRVSTENQESFNVFAHGGDF